VLDLFACAGIGADGYAAAGYDVVGVDVDADALRHNPHETLVADAMDLLADPAFLATFDLIHASPPCWRFTRGNAQDRGDPKHPDLLTPTLALLRAQSTPWIVENVPDAPMPGALVLCGTEFGLAAHDPGRDQLVTLKRHRLFLASFDLWGAGGCYCAADRARGRIAGIYKSGSVKREKAKIGRKGYTPAAEVAAALLGLDRYVPYRYMTQAIPPAYTEFLGRQALDLVGATS
jgi:DNA (cytosine-5)-methyltransferase 1